MEHFVAIMFLVGCGADGANCHEIDAPTPFYASVQDCENELGMQMRLTSTMDQNLLGSCTPVDSALLEQSATLEWAVSRAGQLVVEVKGEREPALAHVPSHGSADVQVAAR